MLVKDEFCPRDRWEIVVPDCGIFPSMQHLEFAALLTHVGFVPL